MVKTLFSVYHWSKNLNC